MADTRVVETHTSILFFVGDHVYKLKKSIDLGFLDHRDREARQATCRNEVDLNRRLAPDVYLGVVDLVGEDGEPIDHLVDMRRMPGERRLSRCIERGEDVRDALRTVGHLVAGLHERSATDPEHDAEATGAAVLGRWTEGFEQLRHLALDASVAARMGRMEALALRYLSGRRELFDRRIGEGRIRDGHGDLQAEDVFVLDDGPRILDCLEFDERYRWGDVLADVAFLAMDLERLGRPDLADGFLALHRELSADRWPRTLADHYVAYRAHVRAKVGILRNAQSDDPHQAEVDRYVDLAIDHLERAQVQLVLVGGSPGTGKSTVAAGLGDRLGAVVLRTDEVRDRVVPSGGDRYRPAAVAAVYRETLVEARRLAGLGEHVIVDATWSSAPERELARRAAAETRCDLTELRCTLPQDEAIARLQVRARQGTDPSEATPEVAERIAARFDPWPEATELPTIAAPDTVAEQALEVLQQAR